MQEFNPSREIAELEWRKVTSLAWPILASISLFYALITGSPLVSWKISYAFGLLLSIIASYLLRRFKVIKFADLPTVCYLLVAPIFIGNRAEEPWFSLGLAVFAAVIYFSTIADIRLAFSTVIALCFFQSFMANQNLSSFTDSRDLSLFGSYFSFSWTLVIGISSIFINRRYLRFADSIETRVSIEIARAIEEISSMKQINQKNSTNIKLHGTILNTLIYMRNQLLAKHEVGDLFPTLLEEIREIPRGVDEKGHENLERLLSQLISNRTRMRINVNLETIVEDTLSAPVTDSILEIVRELILNLEKHSLATQVTINIYKNNNDVKIVLRDNALFFTKFFRRSSRINDPLKSRTLRKLLEECGGQFRISLAGITMRKSVINIPDLNFSDSLANSISEARLLGLNDFVMNFIRAGYLVLLLSVPAYVIVGTPLSSTYLLVLTSISFFFVLRGAKSNIPLILSVLSTLLMIPSASTSYSSCENLSTLPWIWNHLLAVGFYVAINVKNRILKWTPIIIFTLQSIIYPLSYPEECKSIMYGSLPAIPLFIAFAISVMGVRKRELTYDKIQAGEITRLAQSSSDLDQYQSLELDKLLLELGDFAQKVSQLQALPAQEQLSSINAQIEKIQNFLVCSEHFDSLLVRGLYSIFRDANSSNIRGKIQILGSDIYVRERNLNVNHLLEFVKAEKSNLGLSLTIAFVDKLELYFEGYEDLVEGFEDFTDFRVFRNS